MSSRKRNQIGITLIAAVIAVVAVWILTQSKHTSGPVVLGLRLKWLYDPSFAGEMVASKNGLFEKRGMKINIHPGGFESDPIKLVANGSDTFGVAGADSFLIGRGKDIPIVAFAAGFIETPVVFYSKADTEIQTPTDWRGKRIGIQPGQDTETIYRVLLTKSGLTKNDVTEVPVKYDFSPFLTGRLDVWPGYAATQSYILHQKGIPYRTLTPSEFGVKYIGTVYFTTETVLKEHPEWVRQFLAAVIEGWELTYSNREAAIKAISAFDPKTFTPDLIDWNLEKQKPFIQPEGTRFCQFTITAFDEMQRILRDQGLLKTELDLSKAINVEFLKSYYSTTPR
jgi:ABC-type nitrate/sulfonate/bicarbonate transport system substrate-binding protein